MAAAGPGREPGTIRNVGFISTRIAGTDGVSLEIAKWAAVLERNGYACFYFCGSSDRPEDRSWVVPEAHFEHPEVAEISRLSFGVRRRPRQASSRIHRLKERLKDDVYRFVEHFAVDLIVTENALSIPANLPLGLAITEFIAETGMPTIGHHHDFHWERDRFLVNAVTDYLDASFPPDLPTIEHVVINSLAGSQLSHRKGISNTLIPNVYDYANPPGDEDADRCQELRRQIGLGDGDPLILQPTRVVPRKRIEQAIDIVHQMRLDNPVLVISHASGDEGDTYNRRIREYAATCGVRLAAIDHLVRPPATREGQDGRPFTIGDVYRCADLVTYPSGYEGFGNAFLEAIYYRKPIVVNRYSIYVVDIEPKGFDVVTIDGFVTRGTIERLREVLGDPERRRRMTEHNYQLALRYYSYEVLEETLLHLVHRLSRRVV